MKRMTGRKYNDSFEIAKLLSKMVTGELTSKDRDRLAALINNNNLNNQEDLTEILNRVNSSEFVTTDKASREQILSEIKSKMNSQKLSVVRRLLPYAAAALIAITVAVGVYYTQVNTQYNNANINLITAAGVTLEYPSGDVYSLTEESDVKALINKSDTLPQEVISTKRYTISVPLGKSYTVALEDGTSVILFPGSKFSFPAHFAANERLVNLEGEGYFDVESDASRPFQIAVGEVKVRVLGTSFNVRAYPGETTVETALVSGKVIMNDVRIVPDQMAVYDNDNKSINVTNIEATLYYERANGMFVFNNKSLEAIMSDLNKWYEFDYEFKDDVMKDKRFRFKLSRDEDFVSIMKMMELTGDVKFKINDKHVEILAGK